MMTESDEDDSEDSSPEYISDSEIFPHEKERKSTDGVGSLLQKGALDVTELQALRERQVLYLASGSDTAAAAEVLAHSNYSFPDAVTALMLPRTGDDGATQLHCPICMENGQDGVMAQFSGCNHWLCSDCFLPYVVVQVRTLLGQGGTGAAVPCPQCKAGNNPMCAPGLVGEESVRLALEAAGEEALFQRFREERKRVLPRYQAQCTSATCQRVVRAPPRARWARSRPRP